MDNENYLGCTRPMTDRLKARLDASRMWGDLVPKGEDKHLATVNFECGAMLAEKKTVFDTCKWLDENIKEYTIGWWEPGEWDKGSQYLDFQILNFKYEKINWRLV